MCFNVFLALSLATRVLHVIRFSSFISSSPQAMSVSKQSLTLSPQLLVSSSILAPKCLPTANAVQSFSGVDYQQSIKLETLNAPNPLSCHVPENH